MGYGTPAVNLHSPGTIGDVTPAQVFGTTFGALSAATSYTSAQLRFDYDSTHRGRIFTDSSGNVWMDSPDAAVFLFANAGSVLFKFQGGTFAVNGAFVGIAVDSGGTRAAGRVRFSMNGVTDTSGVGMTDGGADNTIGWNPGNNGGADAMLLTSTQLTLSSGVALRIGTSAVTGLTPGVLAATTNALFTINVNGTVYRVPCII